MSEFVTHLQEVFREFGIITSRKMFGGYGIYHDGLMFGLVAEDELYLKTDSKNITRFTDINLEAFQYNKQGKLMTMSYYRAPEEIYDDPEIAGEWANLAFEAALRAKSGKNKHVK